MNMKIVKLNKRRVIKLTVVSIAIVIIIILGNLSNIIEMIKQNNKELVLPSVIPCVRNVETNIFYDNVLLNTSIENVERIEVTNQAGGKYNKLRDRWRILFDESDTDFTQQFGVYFNNNKSRDHVVTSEIKILDRTVGRGKTKRIIFIGDSLTYAQVYEKELIKMFSEDEMDIELLGTYGEGEIRHEGRHGWAMKHYCTEVSYNDQENAFWNPATLKFDFSYYMEKQGYTELDYVFINMGTNDMGNPNDETMDYYKEMINSIKEYDSDISVFIGLCPPLAKNNDNINLKNKRIELMKKLLEKYDGRESDKIFICPLVLNFDAENGFRTETIESNRYEHENLEIVKDNTHPYNSEYYKMADTIYCTIKYAVSLEEY